MFYQFNFLDFFVVWVGLEFFSFIIPLWRYKKLYGYKGDKWILKKFLS
jgi:hypothetical protein